MLLGAPSPKDMIQVISDDSLLFIDAEIKSQLTCIYLENLIQNCTL